MHNYGFRYNIRVIRQTLSQLLVSARLHPTSHALLVKMSHHTEPEEELEVSLIYFRATYTPTDFPSNEYWSLRGMLEQSRAIKCPSLPLQVYLIRDPS